MDCLEKRRRLMANPQDADPLLREHLASCPSCRALQQRLLRMDDSLRLASESIPVPSGLVDRVLLAQATDLRRQRRRQWLLALPIAACLTLALWTLLRVPSPPALEVEAGGMQLAALALDHLSHEPDAPFSRTRVPEQSLRQAFARMGLAGAEHLTEVRYLQPCPVGPYRSLHLVFADVAGAVTGIYLPGARVSSVTEVQDGVHSARVSPQLGGALVLIGARGQDLEPLEQNWAESLVSPATVAQVAVAAEH